MAGLSFEINVEQEKLDKFIASLQKLKKTIASIPTASNEFKQIDAQISILEKKVEKSINRIAEMQKKAGKSANTPSLGAAPAPAVNDEEYKRLIEALKEVVGERAKNIASMLEEETALKILKRELSVIADKERESGKLSDAQTKRRIQVANSIQEHKQSLSSLRQVVSNDIKLQQAAETSMESMSQSLGKMRMAYRKLDEATRESQFGKDLLKNIATTDAKLKELDASIGNYQRNVGNYASSWNGLQYQMQMVARELPNFAISPQIGILSLTNNIPYLVDELQKAKKAYQAYIAAVKAGETDLKAVPSVGKQVLSSLLNWQTAIVMGITLITAYRSEITEWIGGLFKAKDATIELANSETQLALARREAMKSTVKERTELDLLYKKLKDVSLSTKERSAVANEWLSKYPQYSNVLNGEKVSLSNLETAYRSLSRQIIESAKARAYADKIETNEGEKYEINNKRIGVLVKIVQFQDRINQLEAEYKNETDKGVKATIRSRINIIKEGEGGINSLKEQVKEYEIAISNIDKINNNLSNGINTSKLFPQPEKDTYDYWQQQVQIADKSLKQINDSYLTTLKKGVTTGIPENVVKQYQDAIKLKTEAEKALQAYDFKDTKGGSYNSILSQQEKVKDLLAKQARDRIRYEEDMYNEIEQIRINSLDEGYKKTIAQMELNHEKEMQAIDREKEDLLQKRREEAKAVFNAQQEELAKGDKNYKKQTFDESTVVLSDKDNKMFDAKYNAQLEEQAKDAKDIWESMLKNYQDYDAKRAEIDKKYNEVVMSLQAEREKAEKGGNATLTGEIDRAIIEAEKKRKEEQSNVSLEEFKTDIDWANLFGNLDVLSASSLDNLRNKLKEFINAAASKLTAEDLKTLSDALTDIDLTLADKSPYEVLKTSLKGYKGATEEASKAQERLNKFQKEDKGGTKEYKDATKELTDAEKKRSESLKTMTQATNSIGEKGQQVVQAGSDIVSMLTSLGVSVPESVSGALDGMGQIMSAMASIDLMKPASILTGITGTLAGIGKTIGSIFGGKGNKALKDSQRLESVTNRIAETEKVINSFIEKRIGLIKNATIAEQKNIQVTTKQAIDNQKAYYEQQFKGLRGNWVLGKKGKNNNLTAEDLGLNSIEDLKEFLESSRLNDFLQNQGFGLRDADKWRELVNSWDNLIEKEKELEELTAQNLVGITLDDAKNALDEFVKDANSKFSDVADSFEDHMRNALFNIVKQNYLNKAMEKWYSDFEKAMEDETLDETEAGNLKKGYEDAYKTAQDMYLNALKAAGISSTGGAYSQEASKKGFATMSQESADELNGRFTALQIAGESIKQLTSEQTISLASIVAEMQSVRETVLENTHISGETLQKIAEIYLETQGIHDDTTLMTKSLSSISKDIAEVRKNTSRL